MMQEMLLILNLLSIFYYIYNTRRINKLTSLCIIALTILPFTVEIYIDKNVRKTRNTVNNAKSRI